MNQVIDSVFAAPRALRRLIGRNTAGGIVSQGAPMVTLSPETLQQIVGGTDNSTDAPKGSWTAPSAGN